VALWPVECALGFAPPSLHCLHCSAVCVRLAVWISRCFHSCHPASATLSLNDALPILRRFRRRQGGVHLDELERDLDVGLRRGRGFRREVGHDGRRDGGDDRLQPFRDPAASHELRHEPSHEEHVEMQRQRHQQGDGQRVSLRLPSTGTGQHQRHLVPANCRTWKDRARSLAFPARSRRPRRFQPARAADVARRTGVRSDFPGRGPVLDAVFATPHGSARVFELIPASSTNP